MIRRACVGAVGGVVASVVMTGAVALAKSAGMLGEPPPKKLTRRILTLLGHRPSGPGLYAATALAHLAYGAGAGALYTMLPRRVQGPVGGSVFGIAVWAASYMGWIPKLGLMRRPSRDRRGRPTAMVLAHVIFGTALDRAVQPLQP